MKILVSWLREFVPVADTPQEIAARLSVRGFAVEGIEEAGGDDAVLDVEITANRPDCMCVTGIAREVATAYALAAAGLAAASPAVEADGRPGLAEASPGGLEVILDDPDLCPRYVGAVADVTVGSSPDWIQARLRASGIRPISNIVDITNYVLLELGQPMHAFDAATISRNTIRVRTARAGETLRTLDGQDRELSPDMLVIADAERAVAVAGVMGGADSEVTSGTTTVIFESAYFNPLSVRRTSKKLGVKTEASMRFERGADPHLPAVAMMRALELVEQIGAGTRRGTPVDRTRSPLGIEPLSLHLRRAKVAGLLGATIPDEEIERILSGLGFSAVRADEGWRVAVPTRRVDVLREVDLLEEIARHYGFDRIPVRFPALTAATAGVDPRILRARRLRGLLTGAGFSEAVTFGFISESAAAPFAADGDLVAITNPLSESFAVLRPSVLPGLVDAVAHNRRREQRDVRLFEVGNRFSRAAGERRAVACAWTGTIGDHWSGGARDVDFFDLKGVVERIAQAAGLDVTTASHAEPWLAPGRAAAVLAGGTRIGVLGQLAPALAERHGLPAGDAVYVAEIDLDTAEALGAGDAVRVEPLPRYPSVTRDISILVDDTLPAAEVRRTIEGAAPATLARVREFDRYQGKGVPEGKVSLSLRLTFRSPERTLTDAEVQAAMDAVLSAVRERHGAVQR